MTPGPAGRPVLVIGSYPPAATPGTAATLDAVRALLREGADPIVSSPRPSAAPYEVAVAGAVAGRRLLQLQRATGAREVVICAERDFPVPTSATTPVARAAVARLTVLGLARAARSFDRVTVVRSGDTGVPDVVWAPLDRLADLVQRRPAGPSWPGVTPLGPEEDRVRHQGRRVARAVARRALGRSYGPARARAAGALDRARALGRRVG